jgi:uncharacterized protein YjbI with pentapeptide repeats
MADAEQLARLRRSVMEWNVWRNNNKGVEIDLRKADLQESDLHRANLREADLRLADLSLTDLRRADLREAHLTRAYENTSLLARG